MPVEDGPYHLVTDDHINRLISAISSFNINPRSGDTTQAVVLHDSGKKSKPQAHQKKDRRPKRPKKASTSQRWSPLDHFFRSYPSFEYDPSLPPATSYNLLRRQQNWKRNSPESDDGWARYQNALTQEFQLWYGKEDDLNAWHALCRAIGVEPLPETCEACKSVRAS